MRQGKIQLIKNYHFTYTYILRSLQELGLLLVSCSYYREGDCYRPYDAV